MQTKNFFKCFSNISVSFLFIWNWDDKTFIRFRSSLEHHTRFYNKSVYPFSDQNGPKPHPWGWHIPIMAYIRLYPPYPPRRHSTIIWTDLIVTDFENTTVSCGSPAKKNNRWEKLTQFMLERRANCDWKWCPPVLESHQSLHWLW